MTPSSSEVAAALLATLRAGTHNGSPISASLSDGSEVVMPHVVVGNADMGFDTLGEGWLPNASEWTLHLYSQKNRGPHVGTELAFFDSVCEALMASPDLGGVVSGAYPVSSPEPSADAAGVDSEGNPTPPTAYRREIRMHIDH